MQNAAPLLGGVFVWPYLHLRCLNLQGDLGLTFGAFLSVSRNCIFFKIAVFSAVILKSMAEKLIVVWHHHTSQNQENA